MDAQPLDQIYECSFVPELWPGVLAQLVNIASARTGWLFTADGDRYRLSVSHDIVRLVLEPLVADGTVARSQRFAKLCAAQHAGFLREGDIYTDDELESDPMYRYHISPLGLGHAAATTFVLPTQDRVLVCLEREKSRGPVEA